MQWPDISPDYLTYALQLGKAALFALIGSLIIIALRTTLKKQLLKIYPDALRVNVMARIMTYALFFLLTTVILQQFGINMTAIIGAAGVIGVAIGFAAQTSVANIISGLFLTFEHPFSLNDSVIINNVEGKVQALDLFAVTICTFDNKIVRISNEQVLKATITNVSKKRERRYNTSIEIVAQADPKQAIALINQLPQELPYLIKDKAPFIAITETNGSYTHIAIGVWTTQKEWGTTRAAFLVDVKKVFSDAGIALATKNVTVQ